MKLLAIAMIPEKLFFLLITSEILPIQRKAPSGHLIIIFPLDNFSSINPIILNFFIFSIS